MGSANPEELNIAEEAISERHGTWAALTDVFGIPILTEESKLFSERYKAAVEQERAAFVKTFFEGTSIPASADEKVLAGAAGLFNEVAAESLIKPPALPFLSDPAVFNTVCIVACVLFGVLAFVFSRVWQKRKKQRSA